MYQYCIFLYSSVKFVMLKNIFILIVILFEDILDILCRTINCVVIPRLLTFNKSMSKILVKLVIPSRDGITK